MFRNKYVIGVLISIAIFGVTAGGGILVLSHKSKGQDKQASLAGASASSDSTGSASNQPITLSQDSATGPTISDNANASGSAASSDASKLLDPTSFAQYDKYKDAQSAQYIDLQAGTGTAVASGSQVAVLYKGWLTNGTLFDQTKTGSDGKLQAFSFVEGQHQVISGWEAGLAGVKSGGVRLLIIPPTVGYGAQGSGPVPGNAVLIFQVQVIQVT